jgi:hypothetical protein
MPATPASAALQGATYIIDCKWSGEQAKIDPIVSPGAAGAHSHDFFGTGSTNSSDVNYISSGVPPGPPVTTVQTLLKLRDGTGGITTDRTNCNIPSDNSGYWIPTVFCRVNTILADGSPNSTPPTGDGNTKCSSVDGIQGAGGILKSGNYGPIDFHTYWKSHMASGNVDALPQLDSSPHGFGMVFGCINAAKTGSGDCTDPVGVTQIKWDCGANGGINGVTTQQSDLPYDCSPDYLNPTNGGIDGVTMIIRSFHCFQSSFTPSGSTPQNYTGAMEAFNNGSITNGTTCPTHIGQPPDTVVESLEEHIHFGIWNPCISSVTPMGQVTGATSSQSVQNGLTWTNGCGPVTGTAMQIGVPRECNTNLSIGTGGTSPDPCANSTLMGPQADPTSLYSMHADFLNGWNSQGTINFTNHTASGEHSAAVLICLNGYNPYSGLQDPTEGTTDPCAGLHSEETSEFQDIE